MLLLLHRHFLDSGEISAVSIVDFLIVKNIHDLLSSLYVVFDSFFANLLWLKLLDRYLHCQEKGVVDQAS